MSLLSPEIPPREKLQRNKFSLISQFLTIKRGYQHGNRQNHGQWKYHHAHVRKLGPRRAWSEQAGPSKTSMLCLRHFSKFPFLSVVKTTQGRSGRKWTSLLFHICDRKKHLWSNKPAELQIPSILLQVFVPWFSLSFLAQIFHPSQTHHFRHNIAIFQFRLSSISALPFHRNPHILRQYRWWLPSAQLHKRVRHLNVTDFHIHSAHCHWPQLLNLTRGKTKADASTLSGTISLIVRIIFLRIATHCRVLWDFHSLKQKPLACPISIIIIASS